MSKQNEALVRDYLGWTVRGDLDATLDRVWAQRIAYHGRELGELTTREQLKAMLRGFAEAMPDIVCEIQSILSNDEYVVAKMSVTGTELGDDGSGTVRGSGRKLEFSGIDMWRVKDGKLVEQWVIEGLADYHNPKRARID
jgi:predicted ester cyclase